jgi:hypothetical protein
MNTFINSFARRSLAFFIVLTLALNSNAINAMATEDVNNQSVSVEITNSSSEGENIQTENGNDSNTEEGSSSNNIDASNTEDISSADATDPPESDENAAAETDDGNQEDGNSQNNTSDEKSENNAADDSSLSDNSASENAGAVADDQKNDDADDQNLADEDQIETELSDETVDNGGEILGDDDSEKKSENSAWLVDYEYSVDENAGTITLTKNTSFTYGNGLLIIPSAALIDGKKYNVTVTFGDDFFCQDTKNNAKAVYFGSSYYDALRFLSECADVDQHYAGADFISLAQAHLEDVLPWMNECAEKNGNYDIKMIKGYCPFDGFAAEYYFLKSCDCSNVSQLFNGTQIKYVNSDTLCAEDFTDMMFAGCNNLLEVYDVNINADNVTAIFVSCLNLFSAEVTISGTPVSYGMFSGCESLKSVTVTGIDYKSKYSGVNAKSSIYANGMFSGCTNLEKAEIHNLVIDQPFSMFDECPKLDDVSFKNSTLSAYISKDSSSYEENKFYDYSDEYSGEVQLFDRRAKLSRLVTFDKIVGGSDWEKYPFVFLSGGLYRNEDSSDKKIYREITSDTKGGIVLNRLNDDEYKTVTFVDDKNKGEYTFDYQNNKKIDTIPAANTYKGRLFDGWYTEQTGGSEIGYSHVVSDDLTVYARFEGDDVQGDDWKEADSPWLKDYEYHLDGDNIVLDKNISFTYGNGLLIIPSAAYLNKQKYNVVLNLGEGFFCDDAKYASVVYFGESYKDALYSLKEAYYYDPMNNNFYFKNTASDFIESFKGEYPTWMTVENGDGYSTHNYISATGTAYGLFKNFGTEYYFLTNCDFYNVESCSAMFYGSGIKLLTKDTISIPYYADCSQMFEGCGNLTELMGLYISSSSCYRMFADCDSLEYVHDLQFGNDFSVQAAEMFEGCESLRQATILGPEEFSNIFDYKHPKISIYRMFSNCDNLTNVDLNYLTITDIDHAFWGCSQIHDVSFAHSDWEPYDNRYYDELMNRGSKTYYDLTDGNRVEYQIFDRTADVMYVENFESIEGDGFEPFIFLNGGIYRKSTYSNGHNTIDKSKYYRYLDSNTPANAYLETNWIHGSEDETCSITFDDGSKDYYYFRYLKGSKIDILPKPISYDEKQFNGWFTRIPYGKEIKVGQQIDANESAIAALQYPYEIKYNSEMPSFQNGAFS